MLVQQHKQLDFTGQKIHVGIDMGKQSWKSCIYTSVGEHKTFSQPPRPQVLANYLHTNFPNAEYLCAYEAGFSGFWACEELNRLGIHCIVVHPADIPTTDKEHAFKTDARDARKIARLLKAGELVPLYVPSQQNLLDRTWVRMRQELVKKQTRCKNQIKSRLAFFGITIPDERVRSHWSKPFLLWLDELASTTVPQLTVMVEELRFLRSQILRVTNQIRHLAAEERYQQQAACLISVPGVSTVSGMTFLTEIVDIKRFASFDALASYCGLIPGERSSGKANTKPVWPDDATASCAICLSKQLGLQYERTLD